MTMERFEELAILNSIGALDGDEQKELKRFLSVADRQSLSKVAAWNETATMLAATSGVLKVPAPCVKQNLMRKIQERHATERALEGPGTPRVDHSRGIYSMFPDRMEWSKHPVDGVYFKVLTESERRGYVTMLMKVEPGTIFPEHHHTGEEECYILNGSIVVNGRRLGPGILHHGDEESEHGILSTEEGALLLLVVAKEDYIPPVEA